MPELNLAEHTHRRYNILTGEWILVSPHRMKRPWQGKIEKPPQEDKQEYDSDCYLCPGNDRAGGVKNPKYKSTFVFDNDFGALLPGTPTSKVNKENLLIAKGEPGICRVICFSPHHDLTLAEMKISDIKQVIDVWAQEFKTLGKKPEINYVQIFENKGEIMGCSNPHPHGQIWASHTIPGEPQKEQIKQLQFYKNKNKCLLCEYLNLEKEIGERVIYENNHFICLVPFWAIWPFETMIISNRHINNLLDFTDEEKISLAETIRNITIRYDNIFNISFPYSSGIHQSPTNDIEHPEWHFHMHFYPPLLRSATIRKFMVGFEMLGNPQRDITAEVSADRLRNLSGIHYKEKR